jgi:predicted nucleotidyltransferase
MPAQRPIPLHTTETAVPLEFAQRVALRYAECSQVEAVVLGGSRTSESSDAYSDIDLYVYAHQPLPLEVRRKVAESHTAAEIGNEFWEPGDEWVEAGTGISVDVMFRDPRWIEDRLADVLRHHRASVGYSTCFWYNVLHSRILVDKNGWFARLQASARQPYPAALKNAIVAKNFPILRKNMSSYIHQLELAVARRDSVSLQHRVTALLASYFDILFAVNELPHPGEKRLVDFASTHCRKLPKGFPVAIRELCTSQASSDGGIVLARANVLLGGLEELLERERLL